MFLVEAMCNSNLVVSSAEARRLIMQGAIRVNGICLGDVQEKLDIGSHKIRIGKRGEFEITIHPNEQKVNK